MMAAGERRGGECRGLAAEPSDVEDPAAVGLVLGAVVKPTGHWRRLGVKAGALLGCLALGATLAWAHWGRAGASSRRPGASTGLSLLGQGYTRLPETECWLRTRIGDALLNVGAKACQSSCDFREECMAFEMYEGGKHCMLLSNCSGWASGTAGAYVMVKEPGFFGIGRPMLTLPEGMEEGRPSAPGPRPREETKRSWPRWKLPAWSGGGGEEHEGEDAAPERLRRPPPPPPRPGPGLPGGLSLPRWRAPALPELPWLFPGGGQASSQASNDQKGMRPPRPQGIALERPQGEDASVEERHKKLHEKPLPPQEDAAPDKAATHPLTHKVAFTADMYGQVSTGTQHEAKSQQAAPGHKRDEEAEDGNRTVSFYVYRAQSGEDYPAENVNVADLPGVLWYLHSEVITKCPRKFDISRVIRLKFTAKLGRRRSFIPFVAFDSGKCTVPGCDKFWQRYGYHVGCQRTGAEGCYGHELGHWYSLPGPCPGKAVGAKGGTCRKAVPGGACASLSELHQPGGKCTYYIEKDGEILLNKLVGIANYTAFCEQGHAEYDEATDKGRGLNFWDGKHDRWKATWRLAAVRSYLKLAYPNKPDSFGEDEPHCGYPSSGHKCLSGGR